VNFDHVCAFQAGSSAIQAAWTGRNPRRATDWTWVLCPGRTARPPVSPGDDTNRSVGSLTRNQGRRVTVVA
jgi:hypothetical protein